MPYFGDEIVDGPAGAFARMETEYHRVVHRMGELRCEVDVLNHILGAHHARMDGLEERIEARERYTEPHEQGALL